jgi:hypothetical protein
MRTLRISHLGSVLTILTTLAAGCGSSDVAQQNEGMLQAFEQLPLDDAKAEYHRVDVEHKRALWDAHLARFQSSDRLNAAQRDAVADLRANLEAAMGPEAKTYQARLGAVMSEELLREITENLGNAPLAVQAPSAEEASYFVNPDCNTRLECSSLICGCNVASLCYVGTCKHGCAVTSSGCGWLYVQTCDSYGVNWVPSCL